MREKIWLLSITIGLGLFATNVYAKPTSKELLLATDFIVKLSAKSPYHDDIPLREFSLQDVNHDGVYEVLETVNSTEENAVGLLNVEMAPAFEWIAIYKLEKGEYVEKTKDFKWFLQKRNQFYQMWLSLLEKPEALSADSKELISKNKTVFKATIEKLKTKTE